VLQLIEILLEAAGFGVASYNVNQQIRAPVIDRGPFFVPLTTPRIGTTFNFIQQVANATNGSPYIGGRHQFASGVANS